MELGIPNRRREVKLGFNAEFQQSHLCRRVDLNYADQRRRHGHHNGCQAVLSRNIQQLAVRLSPRRSQYHQERDRYNEREYPMVPSIANPPHCCLLAAQPTIPKPEQGAYLGERPMSYLKLLDDANNGHVPSSIHIKKGIRHISVILPDRT